mmetsp:Transcript_144512/g.402639  ORF Transcript_144512/g.402639 Transcript_144512/m.402639 type:complete len:413 (-) Transcript_144512:180-1418(-)
MPFADRPIQTASFRARLGRFCDRLACHKAAHAPSLHRNVRRALPEGQCSSASTNTSHGQPPSSALAALSASCGGGWKCSARSPASASQCFTRSRSAVPPLAAISASSRENSRTTRCGSWPKRSSAASSASSSSPASSAAVSGDRRSSASARGSHRASTRGCTQVQRWPSTASRKALLRWASVAEKACGRPAEASQPREGLSASSSAGTASPANSAGVEPPLPAVAGCGPGRRGCRNCRNSWPTRPRANDACISALNNRPMLSIAVATWEPQRPVEALAEVSCTGPGSKGTETGCETARACTDTRPGEVTLTRQATPRPDCESSMGGRKTRSTPAAPPGHHLALPAAPPAVPPPLSRKRSMWHLMLTSFDLSMRRPETRGPKRSSIESLAELAPARPSTLRTRTARGASWAAP